MIEPKTPEAARIMERLLRYHGIQPERACAFVYHRLHEDVPMDKVRRVLEGTSASSSIRQAFASQFGYASWADLVAASGEEDANG